MCVVDRWQASKRSGLRWSVSRASIPLREFRSLCPTCPDCPFPRVFSAWSTRTNPWRRTISAANLVTLQRLNSWVRKPSIQIDFQRFHLTIKCNCKTNLILVVVRCRGRIQWLCLWSSTWMWSLLFCQVWPRSPVTLVGWGGHFERHYPAVCSSTLRRVYTCSFLTCKCYRSHPWICRCTCKALGVINK